ncbi:MAG: hypothetical protein KAS32_09820 [Candidatus Peribacteraceae bacterium]|nr:hypothetical protein [Candidatus Peribacteraceae bacterium]
MLVIDYIKRKNAIIFKHTDMVLVPEDQIEECEQKLLSMEKDMMACPYCVVYFDYNTGECGGCPMARVGNDCEEGSTYRNIDDKYDSLVLDTQPWYEELRDLIDEYNSEL